jgi:hypothetical protein
MELDRVPLWRGNDVAVKQLTEDFSRYLYLPRLLSSSVLAQCISEGVSYLTWEQDSLPGRIKRDEAALRYRGLRCVPIFHTPIRTLSGSSVKPDVALKQLERESKPVRIELSPERVELRPSEQFHLLSKPMMLRDPCNPQTPHGQPRRLDRCFRHLHRWS